MTKAERFHVEHTVKRKSIVEQVGKAIAMLIPDDATPEQRLWGAVIEQAFVDIALDPAFAKKKCEERLVQSREMYARMATSWLRGPDARTVAMYAGIEIDTIRKIERHIRDALEKQKADDGARAVPRGTNKISSV